MRDVDKGWWRWQMGTKKKKWRRCSHKQQINNLLKEKIGRTRHHNFDALLPHYEQREMSHRFARKCPNHDTWECHAICAKIFRWRIWSSKRVISTHRLAMAAYARRIMQELGWASHTHTLVACCGLQRAAWVLQCDDSERCFFRVTSRVASRMAQNLISIKGIAFEIHLVEWRKLLCAVRVTVSSRPHTITESQSPCCWCTRELKI